MYSAIPNAGIRDTLLLKIIDAINAMLKGRGNSIGTFTTIASGVATTTVVTDNRFESGMTIDLMPMDVTASTCDWYISSRGTGTFTVTHLPTVSPATFTYSFRG